jgi:hypothetical protein
MTSKNVKRMARAMQEATGRSYVDCLNELAKQGEIYQHVKEDGTKEWRVTKKKEGEP